MNFNDVLSQQNRQLKEKVEQLENENRALKKSIYELTLWHNLVVGGNAQPFDLDQDITKLAQDLKLPKKKDTAGLSGTEGSHFNLKYDFHGHEGAVYVVQFSNDGELLASGSFDKTIRIWDLQKHQPQVLCLVGHEMLVGSLSWNNDNSRLLSGSFDKTIRLWDISATHHQSIDTRTLTGFTLSTAFNPTDGRVMFGSDSNKAIHIFDTRTHTNSPPPARIFHSSNVNALYCFKDGNMLMCGDNNGELHTYDLRKIGFGPVQSIQTGTEPCPISHVHVSRSPGAQDDEEGRYLAVNSYDDVVHVYDRGTFFGQGNSQRQGPRLLHSLRGHHNRNWPIRSSIFHGSKYNTAKRHESRTKTHDNEDDVDIHECLLLATGSADRNAFIFNIGGPEGTGELQQQLCGHTDRTYCVDFHPSEPILASCSADLTVKIWTPKKSKRPR